jgi:F0F1-type ATP synthase assembly protein I
MNKDDKRSHYQQLLEASALGFMFPVAIGIGFLWGYGMDKLFDTWPWLTAIFTAFGVIAAFLNLFRLALRHDGSASRTHKHPGE